ncbi:hypothetical protein [uncultured Desulfovibrio sp.]|uniref:hypothetical protein n=1 Tax=uncultured Desulfovibrio sp. TaxID=167968 RepID=UPI0027121536|nr:hypothetical protein [uncultured Desulfovibrio sp.]
MTLGDHENSQPCTDAAEYEHNVLLKVVVHFSGEQGSQQGARDDAGAVDEWSNHAFSPKNRLQPVPVRAARLDRRYVCPHIPPGNARSFDMPPRSGEYEESNTTKEGFLPKRVIFCSLTVA